MAAHVLPATARDWTSWPGWHDLVADLLGDAAVTKADEIVLPFLERLEELAQDGDGKVSVLAIREGLAFSAKVGALRRRIAAESSGGSTGGPMASAPTNIGPINVDVGIAIGQCRGDPVDAKADETPAHEHDSGSEPGRMGLERSEDAVDPASGSQPTAD